MAENKIVVSNSCELGSSQNKIDLMNPKLLFLPTPKKIVKDKKYLQFLLPLILGFLILTLIWQKTEGFLFKKAQFNVSLWPQIPFSHLAFSRDLFEKGQKDLSQKQFEIGKNQVEILNKVYLGFLFERDLLETEKIINQEGDIKKQLEILEEQLEEMPYSWQLLLKKAVLSYQIYENEKAEDAWSLAYWLDPNNEEVLVLKDKLEIE